MEWNLPVAWSHGLTWSGQQSCHGFHGDHGHIRCFRSVDCTAGGGQRRYRQGNQQRQDGASDAHGLSGLAAER